METGGTWRPELGTCVLILINTHISFLSSINTSLHILNQIPFPLFSDKHHPYYAFQSPRNMLHLGKKLNSAYYHKHTPHSVAFVWENPFSKYFTGQSINHQSAKTQVYLRLIATIQPRRCVLIAVLSAFAFQMLIV